MFGFKKQRRLNWAPRSFMGGDQKYFSLVDDEGAQDAVRWASNQLEIARHAHQEAQEKNEALTEKIGAMEASLGLCAAVGAKDLERLNYMRAEIADLRAVLDKSQQEAEYLACELRARTSNPIQPRDRPRVTRDVWLVSGPAALKIAELHDDLQRNSATGGDWASASVRLWQYIRGLGVDVEFKGDAHGLISFDGDCVRVAAARGCADDAIVSTNYHYLKTEEPAKCKK